MFEGNLRRRRRCVGTDDGDEVAFEHRLQDYADRVLPIIEAWARAGLPIWRIDGTLGEEELALEVMRMLAGLAPPLVTA